jgi:ethanolamine utilization protein EutP (predicted NTPase)
MEQHKAFLIVTKAVLADKRISATAKLLLGALNSHRNKQTGQ